MFRNRTPSLLPPQFRSIHVGKVWQIYVRRSYYHLNKASHKFAENRAKYSNIRKAKGGETGRRVEIGRARNSSPLASCSSKEFQLLMKLRERIGREFVPMDCWVSAS